MPRLLEATAASDTVGVPKTMITLLALVHLLLSSPLLTPINAWNLIAARETSSGLERRMAPILHCLRAHTSAHTEAVNVLSSVDLANVTLSVKEGA